MISWDRYWHLVLLGYVSGVAALPFLGHVFIVRSAWGTGIGYPSMYFLLVFLGVSMASIPIGVYLDAREMQGDWTPSPVKWGAFCLLYPVSVLISGAYLYRRLRRVGLDGVGGGASIDGVHGSRWWMLSLISAVLGPLGIYVFMRVLLMNEIGLLSISAVLVSIPLYVIGTEMDLQRIRRSDSEWKPSTLWTVAVVLPVIGTTFGGILYVGVRRVKLGRS